MALGKYSDRQFRFNEAQMRKINAFTTYELMEATGLCEAVCIHIRNNAPKDYRISTLIMLAKGLGYGGVGSFLSVK
jgi:hypothetical protein